MNSRYNISIHSEGKPSVSIATDDLMGIAQAMPKILASYGELEYPKEQQQQSQEHTQLVITRDPLNPVAPICAIHHTPMVGMNGKRGFFWSCHEKLDDGSWCRYKPVI